MTNFDGDFQQNFTFIWTCDHHDHDHDDGCNSNDSHLVQCYLLICWSSSSNSIWCGVVGEHPEQLEVMLSKYPNNRSLGPGEVTRKNNNEIGNTLKNHKHTLLVINFLFLESREKEPIFISSLNAAATLKSHKNHWIQCNLWKSCC